MTDNALNSSDGHRGQQPRVDRVALFFSRVFRRLSGGRARLHRYYLVAQPVAAEPLLPPGRGRNIEIRTLGPDDPALAHFPRPSHVMASRFRQGAVCHAAFRDDEPIGFLWFTPGDYDEDEVRCLFRPLPSGVAAWDFDVYVDPAHRIGPAFSKLWDVAYADMRRRGIRWTLSRISAFNPGSIAVHTRLGARILGHLTFVAVGPFQLAAGTCAPYLHAGFRRNRRPVISVHAPSGSATDEQRETVPNA